MKDSIFRRNSPRSRIAPSAGLRLTAHPLRFGGWVQTRFGELRWYIWPLNAFGVDSPKTPFLTMCKKMAEKIVGFFIGFIIGSIFLIIIHFAIKYW